MNEQIVTISFFRFQGFKNRFWAFSMMQLAHKKIANTSRGLSFYKLLGSGKGNGFSWKPNFAVYGLLAIWDNNDCANDFFETGKLFEEYKNHSIEQFTIHLKPLKSHGLWSNQNPFYNVNVDHQGSIAVITRATIKLSKLLSFWRRVRGASESLDNFPGRQFSIGIGEWPWIQQATFSIWDSEEHMMEYAYKNPIHKKIIQMTRERKWYKEELFARFKPVKSVGSWGELGQIKT